MADPSKKKGAPAAKARARKTTNIYRIPHDRPSRLWMRRPARHLHIGGAR